MGRGPRKADSSPERDIHSLNYREQNQNPSLFSPAFRMPSLFSALKIQKNSPAAAAQPESETPTFAEFNKTRKAGSVLKGKGKPAAIDLDSEEEMPTHQEYSKTRPKQQPLRVKVAGRPDPPTASSSKGKGKGKGKGKRAAASPSPSDNDESFDQMPSRPSETLVIRPPSSQRSNQPIDIASSPTLPQSSQSAAITITSSPTRPTETPPRKRRRSSPADESILVVKSPTIKGRGKGKEAAAKTGKVQSISKTPPFSASDIFPADDSVDEIGLPPQSSASISVHRKTAPGPGPRTRQKEAEKAATKVKAKQNSKDRPTYELVVDDSDHDKLRQNRLFLTSPGRQSPQKESPIISQPTDIFNALGNLDTDDAASALRKHSAKPLPPSPAIAGSSSGVQHFKKATTSAVDDQQRPSSPLQPNNTKNAPKVSRAAVEKNSKKVATRSPESNSLRVLPSPQGKKTVVKKKRSKVESSSSEETSDSEDSDVEVEVVANKRPKKGFISRTKANNSVREMIKEKEMLAQKRVASSSKAVPNSSSPPKLNSKDEAFMAEPDYISNLADAEREMADLEDFLATQKVNKADKRGKLCPFCDGAWPDAPSDRLLRCLSHCKAHRKVRDRFSNVNQDALALPYSEHSQLCKLHREETDVIPAGVKEGWPTFINFKHASDRITEMRDDLRAVIQGDRTSIFKDAAFEEWKAQGKHKMNTMTAQFSAFEAEIPGYYGQLGYQAFYPLLQKMFVKTGDLPAFLADPMDENSYVARILIPEAATTLIMQDQGCSREEAIEILQISRNFGIAVHYIEEDVIEDEQDQSPEPVKKTRKKKGRQSS